MLLNEQEIKSYLEDMISSWLAETKKDYEKTGDYDSPTGSGAHGCVSAFKNMYEVLFGYKAYKEVYQKIYDKVYPEGPKIVWKADVKFDSFGRKVEE